ncbi:LacI family DNA-binding transcriptional regulator [Microbacterium sp. YY-01]|uniref:LacI family DNA-binding transcriptional regulator n=1 Tax=Microbacterium sp. YY-01 TaxID=3421634 RepID=UPI003D167A2F
MARIGIRDVAAHAGVAVGTVSHFLNHPDRVSPEKAERIQAAILTLGYVPSQAGRQLRTGVSNVLGYLVPDVSNPHFAEIAEGVEQRAAELGFTVFLANSHRDPTREDAYLRTFEQYRVRGLIVASYSPIEERLAVLRNRGTPSILVGQTARTPAQASVSVDDVDGGRQAAEHLLSLGVRRLAFVGGPLTVPQVADRLAGASMAVRRNGQAALEVIGVDDRTLAGGRAIGEAIFARPPEQRPEGIFAVNDLVALGILQVLSARGVSVPQEVAIVGYDDTEFAQASLVPLTSIHGSQQGLGRIVVDRLMDVIEERAVGSLHHVTPPQLMPRESTTGFHNALAQ